MPTSCQVSFSELLSMLSNSRELLPTWRASSNVPPPGTLIEVATARSRVVSAPAGFTDPASIVYRHEADELVWAPAPEDHYVTDPRGTHAGGLTQQPRQSPIITRPALLAGADPDVDADGDQGIAARGYSRTPSGTRRSSAGNQDVSVRAVATSVTITLTQPPRIAGLIAARLRSPPASPIRRGMAR